MNLWPNLVLFHRIIPWPSSPWIWMRGIMSGMVLFTFFLHASVCVPHLVQCLLWSSALFSHASTRRLNMWQEWWVFEPGSDPNPFQFPLVWTEEHVCDPNVTWKNPNGRKFVVVLLQSDHKRAAWSSFTGWVLSVRTNHSECSGSSEAPPGSGSAAVRRQRAGLPAGSHPGVHQRAALEAAGLPRVPGCSGWVWRSRTGVRFCGSTSLTVSLYKALSRFPG